MKKTALITGATSGIGEATAHRLAASGYNLILTGRREDRLKSVAHRLSDKYGIEVLPLVFDVRSREEVERALANLSAEWREIDVLVNNAGLAVGMSRINEGEIEDWERMIDTNVKGLLYVSRIVSNYMKERGRGHIINICSIAGKEVYLNGNVYCASKHAVDALTKGMRLDLLPYGIKVAQICPGAVETEFSLVRFKGDRERADAVYKGFTPLTADDIADTIAYMVNAPAHVNIADVLILPLAQGSSSAFEKKL